LLDTNKQIQQLKTTIMKRSTLIIASLAIIISLCTSCASGGGNGCGYWSSCPTETQPLSKDQKMKDQKSSNIVYRKIS